MNQTRQTPESLLISETYHFGQRDFVESRLFPMRWNLLLIVRCRFDLEEKGGREGRGVDDDLVAFFD